MSKNKCIGCHFFQKAECAHNYNENLLRSLSKLERAQVKKNDYSFLIGYNDKKQYITCSEWMDGSAWTNTIGTAEITDAALKKRECPCFYVFLPEYINNTIHVRKQRNVKKEAKANRSNWWRWLITVGIAITGIIIAFLNFKQTKS